MNKPILKKELEDFLDSKIDKICISAINANDCDANDINLNCTITFKTSLNRIGDLGKLK